MNIQDITIPYPGKNYLDVTPEMQAQVHAIYFYKSLLSFNHLNCIQ